MRNYLAIWLTLLKNQGLRLWYSHDDSNCEAGPEADGSCEQASNYERVSSYEQTSDYKQASDYEQASNYERVSSYEQASMPPSAPNDSDSDSGAGSSHEQAPIPVPIIGRTIANYGGNQVMYDGRTAVMINGQPMIYSTPAEAQRVIRDLQQRANTSNRNPNPNPAKAPKVHPRPVQSQQATTRTAAAVKPPRVRARAQPAQVYTTTRLVQNPFSSYDEVVEEKTSYRVVDDRHPDKIGVRITQTWQTPADENGNRGSSTQVVNTVYMQRSEFDRIISPPDV